MYETGSGHSDFEAFDGARILDDCAACDDDALPRSLAALLTVRVVANAVRRHARGEDLTDDVAEIHEYLAALSLSPVQRTILRRVLGSLLPFDAQRVAAELMSASRAARRAGLPATARCFAELACDAAPDPAGQARGGARP
jgi:hypothetical protein